MRFYSRLLTLASQQYQFYCEIEGDILVIETEGDMGNESRERSCVRVKSDKSREKDVFF